MFAGLLAFICLAGYMLVVSHHLKLPKVGLVIAAPKPTLMY